jgi:hypothetical protein
VRKNRGAIKLRQTGRDLISAALPAQRRSDREGSGESEALTASATHRNPADVNPGLTNSGQQSVSLAYQRRRDMKEIGVLRPVFDRNADPNREAGHAK